MRILLIKLILIVACNCFVQSIYALEFFNKPAMLDAVISPDGKHVAITVNKGDAQFLNLISLQNKEENTLINVQEFATGEANLKAVQWLDNQHLAVEFIKITKGVANLTDTRQAEKMLVVQIPNVTSAKPIIKSVRTKGELVSALPDQPNVFLYSKKGIYSKLYKIDVRKLLPHKQRMNKLTLKDGGQFKAANEVVSIKGFVINWFIAQDGKPRAAVFTEDNNVIKLNEFNEDNTLQQISLMTWDFEELKEVQKNKNEDTTQKLILPVSLSEQPGVYYSFDFTEDEKRTVYRTNYNTGEYDPIIESNAYKIISLLKDNNNKLIGVKVLKDGKLQNTYLEMLTNDKTKKVPSQELEIALNASLDNQNIVLYKESHSQPGRYFVKQKGNTKLQYLGSLYPALDGQLTSSLIEDNITVSDLDIPYLLSLPRKTSQSLPLVVMPHGGPFNVFDNRYFDITTQYLVANGFAVLRVNFRGSGGYSKELLEAGKKQFGDLILNDIHEVTKVIIKRTDIDENKVCIAGMSYGGYAASMLVIQDPELFRCAVSIAGVSDVNLFLNSATISEAQIKWSKEYIGNKRTDYDKLLAISPIAHIQKLARPILIMHGAKDSVVDVEHAWRMKLLLEKYNKPYDWHIFPEGEHSLSDPEEAKEMFSKMLDFIQTHTN